MFASVLLLFGGGSFYVRALQRFYRTVHGVARPAGVSKGIHKLVCIGFLCFMHDTAVFVAMIQQCFAFDILVMKNLRKKVGWTPVGVEWWMFDDGIDAASTEKEEGGNVIVVLIGLVHALVGVTIRRDGGLLLWAHIRRGGIACSMG